jgi:multidrug efflux pump subunit AcrA (membrane-fusion protein)
MRGSRPVGLDAAGTSRTVLFRFTVRRIPAHNPTRRLAALVTTLIATGALAACSNDRGPGPTSVAVQRGSVLTTVSADGAVESAQELALDFEATGRIAAVTVDEGQRVRRGDVLARLENGAQRDRLGSALANLAAARASLAATRDGLTAVEVAGQARLADQASVDITAARRDLADVRNSSRANLFGLRRALARAQVTGEVADLRAAELRLAQEQSRVDRLRDRYERLRAVSDRDRDELQDQLDRRRDAQNQTPPDEMEINDAAYRIAVLTSKIEDEEADELGAREEFNTAVANVRQYVQDVDRNRISLREARRRLGDASDTLRNGMADARRQVDTARSQLAASQAQLGVVLSRNRIEAQVKAADVAGAIATVTQAQSQTTDARSALEDTVLRAPADGVVGRIEAKVGEVVSGSFGMPGLSGGGSPTPLPGADGSPALTPADTTGGATAQGGAAPTSRQGLITLAQTRGLQVKASFDESDAANLRTGDSARVTVDAFPGRVLAARVASIDPIEAVQREVVTYEATLVLDAPPPGVRPGMSASIDVIVARADGVLTLPRSAVRSPQGANPSVTVVLPDGRRQLRQVATGLQGDARVQILAGVGLGERVLRVISTPVEQGA